jgi:hypothetical protein
MDWKIQHKNHCKTLREINEIEKWEKPAPRSRELWTKSLVSIKQFLSSSVFS